MSEIQRAPGGRPPAGTESVPPAETADERAPTGWVVWMFFAGAMLVFVGVFQMVDGLVALFRNELFSVRPNRLPLDVSYSVWGWTHLLVGAALILLGFAVLAARTWARMIAIALAVVSAVVHFAFLPAYPVASGIVIALDLVVIYALAVHGGELRMGREHY